MICLLCWVKDTHWNWKTKAFFKQQGRLSICFCTISCVVLGKQSAYSAKPRPFWWPKRFRSQNRIVSCFPDCVLTCAWFLFLLLPMFFLCCVCFCRLWRKSKLFMFSRPQECFYGIHSLHRSVSLQKKTVEHRHSCQVHSPVTYTDLSSAFNLHGNYL